MSTYLPELSIIEETDEKTNPDVYGGPLINELLEEENKDSVWPPKTDSGDQQPFKYPFSFGHR